MEGAVGGNEERLDGRTHGHTEGRTEGLMIWGGGWTDGNWAAAVEESEEGSAGRGRTHARTHEGRDGRRD